jgi:membrane protein insertase Oxa1/YidC/SpoIIIJ
MPDIAAASRVFFADHKTPGLKRVLTLFRVNLAILRRHNLRPIYFFLPTISYFIAFVTVVWAFRRVIKFHPDVTHGGLAWFADLSVPDPTYGLPLAAVSLTYASLHMAFRSRAQLDPFTHTVPWIIDKWIALVQLFYIFGFPFIAALPAGVHLYWFASASLGILQMLTLRDARVRRALNIDLPIHAKARMDASRAAPQGSFKPDELLPTSERLSDQLAQASAQQAPPQSAGSDAPKGADHAADEAARTLAASASNKSSSKAP